MNLSIIIPTYNEKENIQILVPEIRKYAPEAEIIVVDDNSPDGTAAEAEKLGIKVLKRVGKRGLSSAVIDGFKIAAGDVFCVMDADLSHPPKKIPEMLSLIEEEKADLVIGSRFVPGGKIDGWNLQRFWGSYLARLLAFPLTNIKDTTSGFIMFKKEVIEEVDLRPLGFKIGLEVIVKGYYSKAVEYPITFTDRKKAKSKASLRVTLEYLLQLVFLYLHLLFYSKNRSAIETKA